MLEFLAKLYFLFVRTFDGEKLHSVCPKRKTVYLLIKHLKLSVILYYLEEFIDVIYIYSYMVYRSIFHLSLMVLIGLNDEIMELKEGNFLIAVYCAEDSLEAQGMIKLNSLIDIVGRNADVLHACCKIFDLHNEFVFR